MNHRSWEVSNRQILRFLQWHFGWYRFLPIIWKLQCRFSWNTPKQKWRMRWIWTPNFRGRASLWSYSTFLDLQFGSGSCCPFRFIFLTTVQTAPDFFHCKFLAWPKQSHWSFHCFSSVWGCWECGGKWGSFLWDYSQCPQFCWWRSNFWFISQWKCTTE